ncbi:MAG: hypothetical protein ACREH4_08185 [Vitreimonas sp.]
MSRIQSTIMRPLTWRSFVITGACVTATFIVGWFIGDAMPEPPPGPATIYCETGAGPVAVDGFDWKTDVHPTFAHVWVLTWRNAPDDPVRQSVALQPPFECEEIGALRP